MTILSVAFALFPVTADSAGGSEQILWRIVRGIVGARHNSITVAAVGSHVSGCLVPTPCRNGQITEDVRAAAHEAHRHAIARVLEKHSIDLIHFHGLDFAAYIPQPSIPMLATLHL